MNFEAPTEDRTELAEGQHQAGATEFAKTRVLLGLSDFLEPIQELQFGDDGELK